MNILLKITCIFFLLGSEIAYSDKITPKVKEIILIGDKNRTDIENFNWFKKNYAAYKTNQEALKALQKVSRNIKVTIIMGTWCHDSQRETPKAYRIFDDLDFEDDNVKLITVDHKPLRDKEVIKKYGLKNIPVFIFSKEGKELGRIIEKPTETFEKDMIKIINP